MIKCISDVCKYIPSLPNGGTHQKVIFVKPKHNTAPSLSRESHREEARVGVGRVFVLQDYNSELLSYGRGDWAAVLFLAHYCHQPILEVCHRKFAIVLTIFRDIWAFLLLVECASLPHISLNTSVQILGGLTVLFKCLFIAVSSIDY